MKEAKKYLLLITAAVTFTLGGIFAYENWERETPSPPLKAPPTTETKTEPQTQPQIIRKPAALGTFYPGGKEELSDLIEGLLENVPPSEKGKAPKILIVPHAGYRFSGPVAAHGFSELRDREYSTVVIIGNSHHYHFDGAAVYAKGFFETPLGLVPINEILTQKLIGENDSIFAGPQYHDKEHSLEMEIPFLQKTLKDFQIVPIILGDQTTATATALAEALAKHSDPYTLVVVSTDLSHYPNYEDAKRADQQTVASIVANDLEKFSSLVEQLPQGGITNLQTAACGAGAVKTALILSQSLGVSNTRLLQYANSGDVTEDKEKIVGYAAIAFYTGRFGAELNDGERQELIKISRETLDTFITTGKVPEVVLANNFLNTPLGAFVTLNKNGSLRGCVGRFEPEDSLWRTIQQVTVAAATEDRRFTPVQSGELDQIEIEISVLSPRRRVFEPQGVVIGKHGVSLVRGERHGAFLPQVAAENNWNLEKFMGELCAQKMSLPRSCWQQDGTQIFVFTAQVFAES